MTDQERFRAAFGHLHASADTLTEVKKRMNLKESNRPVRPASKRALTLALAAALLLVLGVTAYAAGAFGLRVEPATREELQPGAYFPLAAEGNYDYEAERQLPKDGLTFHFTADEPVYRVEFRPGWLPEEPNHAWSGACEVDELRREPDKWYQGLSHDTGPVGTYGDLGIRYQISLAYAGPDYRLVLNGEYQIVKTEVWGDLSVIEAEMLYLESRGQENYVILFSESRGYMVVVGGSEDLETLEHIARELEIRQTDTPVDNSFSGVGIINIGRG